MFFQYQEDSEELHRQNEKIIKAYKFAPGRCKFCSEIVTDRILTKEDWEEVHKFH